MFITSEQFVAKRMSFVSGAKATQWKTQIIRWLMSQSTGGHQREYRTWSNETMSR